MPHVYPHPPVGTTPVPAIYIDAQSGVLTSGKAGTATFVVNTNIDKNLPGSVQWYSDANGTVATSAPAGVTSKVSTGTQRRTLTVTTDKNTPAGKYYFRITIDNVKSSNVGTLEVKPGIVKITDSSKLKEIAPIDTIRRQFQRVPSVSVGEQQTEFWNGGMFTYVSFTVTPKNIDYKATGSVQWYSNSGGTTPTSAPANLSVSISPGFADSPDGPRSLNMTPVNNGIVAAGTYYFRVTIGGVQSGNVGKLLVKQSTITVGDRQGSNYHQAGTTVTFPITTTPGSYPVSQSSIQWYSDSNGTVKASAPAFLTSTFSTGNTNTTGTLSIKYNGGPTGKDIFWFRVINHGIQSNVGVFYFDRIK